MANEKSTKPIERAGLQGIESLKAVASCINAQADSLEALSKRVSALESVAGGTKETLSEHNRPDDCPGTCVSLANELEDTRVDVKELRDALVTARNNNKLSQAVQIKAERQIQELKAALKKAEAQDKSEESPSLYHAFPPCPECGAKWREIGYLGKTQLICGEIGPFKPVEAKYWIAERIPCRHCGELPNTTAIGRFYCVHCPGTKSTNSPNEWIQENRLKPSYPSNRPTVCSMCGTIVEGDENDQSTIGIRDSRGDTSDSVRLGRAREANTGTDAKKVELQALGSKAQEERRLLEEKICQRALIWFDSDFADAHRDRFGKAIGKYRTFLDSHRAREKGS